MEYPVKLWMGMIMGWHKRIMIIQKADYIIKKRKKKENDNITKNTEITFSLRNARVIDKSKEDDIVLKIETSEYKNYIKLDSLNEKNIILNKLKEVIHNLNSETAFSEEYKNYTESIESIIFGNSPFDLINVKLSHFQNLILELTKKLENFKVCLEKKEKLDHNSLFLISSNLIAIKEEMKKQYDDLVTKIYDYHDLMEVNIKPEEKTYKRKLSIENATIKEIKNNPILPSDIEASSEEENDKSNINIKKKKFIWLNDNKVEINNPIYDSIKRSELIKPIKTNNNMIKEIMKSATKKESLPIYFNEPISMLQKQCEKFYYINLLNEASKQNTKELSLCYISAFIIGEIFLNLGRFLKPFNPILGETFEFYDNEKKFRYFAEQVSHNPPISAFIGESEEIILFGDTRSSNSFKIWKGSYELEFGNKIHIYFKKNKDYYIFNRPNIALKGLIKPPIHNDYIGNVIIQNINNKNIKCELIFDEEGWNSNGNFSGKVYNNENKVVYLIKGNWNKEIYMCDPDNKNKIELLKINEEEYIHNTYDKYTLPHFTCKLNEINKDLEENLPKTDSRFRPDMREYENGNCEIAQKMKNEQEEFQRIRKFNLEKEKKQYEPKYFKNENNTISNDFIYVFNGKYWEDKLNGNYKKLNDYEIFKEPIVNNK